LNPQGTAFDLGDADRIGYRKERREDDGDLLNDDLPAPAKEG
jgi:hypothetical protein